MGNKPRVHMPISDRAKQFMPFSALKGLHAALAQKERITVEKIELTEDKAEELDRQMAHLHVGSMISIVYYHNEEYVKLSGRVARLNKASRILQIVNTKISFDDLLEINIV